MTKYFLTILAIILIALAIPLVCSQTPAYGLIAGVCGVIVSFGAFAFWEEDMERNRNILGRF